MKRLNKKGNLTGKKIRFLEDVVYCTIEDIDKRMVPGIEYQGVLNDSMIQDEILKLIEYLKSIDFVKNDKIVIPADTEALITYDNMGNDVDIKINGRLTISIINDFSFNENATEEAIKAEIVE
jgi:hypothetical protein